MLFFFNDTATTEIYTLSLHDALPISFGDGTPQAAQALASYRVRNRGAGTRHVTLDRKSTRLNSSHSQISYAVFCLKKKNATSHIMKLSKAQLPLLADGIYVLDALPND